MKIEILINDIGDKKLYLDGLFYATWSSDVDDMSVIVPFALDQAFELGKKEKEKEVRRILGIISI